MICKVYRIVLFVCFLGMLGTSSQATHLMGGSFVYKYLDNKGSYSTPYRYRITLQMFRDCQNSTTQFDQNINIGIYYNNSSKSKYSTVTIWNPVKDPIDPPTGGSKCSWDPNICIERAIYQTIIELPFTSTGFHLLHQRCCRNELINIDEFMGQSYYAFIPPTTYYNNSPYFSGIPTPYLCSGDTLNLSYAAVDPDGDSLQYSLVVPWQGGSQLIPAPLPTNFLTLPITPAIYRPLYSFNQPFGSSGIATINASTGTVKVLIPQEGFFALAVDVKEYRNGKLLSTVRRDIELIVLNCPPNDLPKHIGGTSFTVDEGNSLTFNITYTDSDSMYFTRTGLIFNPSSGYIPPPYPTLSEIQGKISITTPFTWNTSCDHGKQNPYFFTVHVRDNGCPYKTTVTNFQVRVKPFDGPDRIAGPINVCESEKNVIYRVQGLSTNSTLDWYVQGGTIVSGAGTPSIIVDWGSSGTGIVRAIETSAYGCGSDSLDLVVLVHSLPRPIAGNDVSLCSRDTILIGDINADPTFKFEWSPSEYLSDTSSSAPFFTMKFVGTSPIIKKYFLKVTNNFGCIDYDSITVTVNPEYDTFTIIGNQTPCYSGIFEYNAKNTQSTYTWWANGGIQTSGGNSRKVHFQWFVNGTLHAVEQNIYGCKGDTSFLNTKIVNPRPKIFGSEVVCPNSSNIDYWIVDHRRGSSYKWVLYNCHMARFSNGPMVQVNFGDSGTAKIAVIETTREGCTSDTAIFPVVISYHLKTSDIFGDTFLCEFTTQEQYYVYNTNGSYYSWNIDGGAITSANGQNKIFTDWDAQGYGYLNVLETSYDSVNDKICIGDTVYLEVKINPMPHTSHIQGTFELCENSYAIYTVQGYASSTFIWDVNNNMSFTGQGTNSINFYWTISDTYNISVFELTKDSCIGEVMDTIVTIYPNPITSEILGDSVICYPDNNNIKYNVNGFLSSQYNWKVFGGVITSGNGSSSITANWDTLIKGFISVEEITDFGCLTELKSKEIIIDSLGFSINFITTREENDQEIEIQWEIINGNYFNRKVNLYRKYKDNLWAQIVTFSYNETNYIDENVFTRKYPYSYKVSGENICNEIFQSLPHKSILLKGTRLGDFDIKLNWNNYLGWINGVDHYDIYRQINTNPTYKLYVNGDTDSIEMLEIGVDGFKQCYRTVASKQFDNSVKSWSNQVCFEFDPLIHVPSAFTPNGDGINDEFMISISNIKNLEINIFDRWGERVFSTFSQDEGWDGKHHGELCEQGVYLVLIKFKGNTPHKMYTGTITLIR